MLLLKQIRYYLKFELHSLSLKINKCKDKRYEWRIFELDVIESKGVNVNLINSYQSLYNSFIGFYDRVMM